MQISGSFVADEDIYQLLLLLTEDRIAQPVSRVERLGSSADSKAKNEVADDLGIRCMSST